MLDLKRVAAACIAGALILLTWSFVFWGFLAEPIGMFGQLPDPASVGDVIRKTSVETGTYITPWPTNTPERVHRLFDEPGAGPFYRISYVGESFAPKSHLRLILGTLHSLSVAAIAVAIALLTGGSFSARFGSIVLGGLLGSSFISAGDPIWFHQPWDYVWGSLVYQLIAWTLLGLVVARLTRPADNTQRATPA